VARVQGSAGLGDVVLHPDFEDNRYVYLTYNKPHDDNRGALAVARGVWRNDSLTELTDIFVTDEAGGISRLIFGADGKLYVSTFVGQAENAQNPNSLGGKVLRLNDDGSVPADNPFVGIPDHKPEVYTLGHRTPSGLALHRPSGTVFELEMGPNGGDEVNALVPGGNYGWPIVSLGRSYAGPWQSERFNAEGIEDPIVFWMPSISTSGLDFYTGDRLSAWTGDLFIGGMRYGEISGTGQLHRVSFNEEMQEMRREILFADLRHRIRDVRQSPDGFLYLLTDSDDGAVLRIEPAD
jgi:glucose/arabinose dehydrogenase